MANLTLTQLYGSERHRSCSLEISPAREIDYVELQPMKFHFCAVVWIGDPGKPISEINSIVMAKKLLSKGYPVLFHLAARALTKPYCSDILSYAKKLGIRNILCVRGQLSDNVRVYDFPTTQSLMLFIREQCGEYFELVVVGYPNRHRESKSLEDDMEDLRNKIECGAKYILTQAAFNYDVYKKYIENCKKFKINAKIIPGCYLIRSTIDFMLVKQLVNAPECSPLVRYVEEHHNKISDNEIAEYIGLSCCDLIRRLLADADNCPPHIYTMNEFSSVKEFLARFKH